MGPSSRTRWLQNGFALLALCWISSGDSAAQGLRTLIVGGGPTPGDNQVAIENNVRYVLQLLPSGSPHTVLFADGDRKSKSVVYLQRGTELSQAERTLALVLNGRTDSVRVSERFRETQIAQVDGAAKRADIAAAFSRMSSESASRAPYLLYFSGHGSKAPNNNLHNNRFDLWGEELTVRDLAAHVSTLAPNRPVTLIMVQCYSGSFANLLFEGGDPDGELIDRDIAGFFSTVNDRMAAGCTPEVDEAEYHDFTTYFFAALTGRDRVGRAVRGVDYNGDGRVGMDEAYCYSLAADASIDVPMCTSDVLLRREVKLTNDEVFRLEFTKVRDWATPPQRAALDALSQTLKLSGEDRGWQVFSGLFGHNHGPRANPLAAARRAFNRARKSARESLYGRWPDLRNPDSPAFGRAKDDALRGIERSEAFQFPEMLRCHAELIAARDSEYRRELDEARRLRFVRLFKTVVLAHHIRAGSDETAKQRLARLEASESRSLFPSTTTSARAN